MYFIRTLLLFTVCLTVGIFLRFIDATDIPNCDFHDTVDLTKSKKFDNGSYLYEGVVIPPSLIGEYDYEIIYDGVRETVRKHMRGCVCKLKPCVRFCCHPKAFLDYDTSECTEELFEELYYEPYINITFNNGTSERVHVLQEFVVQQSMPCKNMYGLSPELDKEDRWELFENGTLLRLYDSSYVSKRDYCLKPVEVDNETHILNPMNCPQTSEQTAAQKMNTIGMMISIPFLVLTSIVYMILPELDNAFGKYLVRYLICLALGYTVLVITASSTFRLIPCRILGFFGYFCFMSAFLWLSVICFELWNSQRFPRRKSFKNPLLIYSMYAWGIAGFLTGLTITAQFTELDYALKPGVGPEYCFVKTTDWSAMIYFFGPILVVMLFNLVMFILTVIGLYNLTTQRELKGFKDRPNVENKSRSDKNHFRLFLSLFILMGITWLLEIISYLIGTGKEWSKFVYIFDFFNAVQGFIIFVLFVLKRNVYKSFKNRLFGKKAEADAHSSEEEISLQDRNGLPIDLN